MVLWVYGWAVRKSHFFLKIFFHLKILSDNILKQQQSKTCKYLIFLEIHNKIIFVKIRRTVTFDKTKLLKIIRKLLEFIPLIALINLLPLLILHFLLHHIILILNGTKIFWYALTLTSLKYKVLTEKDFLIPY